MKSVLLILKYALQWSDNVAADPNFFSFRINFVIFHHFYFVTY